MDGSKREEIIDSAIALVKSHFEFLNMGNFAAARQQLFFPPGIQEDPLDVYVKTMGQLIPFRLRSISVIRFEDLSPKRHGDVATVWLDVEVVCSLGNKSADIAVWWFPESGKCQLSVRPSQWVLEKLRGSKDRETKTCRSGDGS